MQSSPNLYQVPHNELLRTYITRNIQFIVYSSTSQVPKTQESNMGAGIHVGYFQVSTDKSMQIHLFGGFHKIGSHTTI